MLDNVIFTIATILAIAILVLDVAIDNDIDDASDVAIKIDNDNTNDIANDIAIVIPNVDTSHNASTLCSLLYFFS